MALFTPVGTTWNVTTTSYITCSEYTHAPTAVDTTDLIPGGSAAENLAELASVIARASSWADGLCDQILAATLDIQTATGIRVRRDGTVRVKCDFWPVLEVDAFSAGTRPSTLAPITDSADMDLIGLQILSVPVAGLTVRGGSGFGYGPGTLRGGDRAYCQWSYTNGWPHFQLGATVAAGATVIPVTPAPGTWVVGRPLTIYDDANGVEIITPTGVVGSELIVAPTSFAHTAPAAPDGLSISALPPRVKEAVICLTSQLIEAAGADAIVMETIEAEPGKVLPSESAGFENLAMAVDLLDRYRRII